MNAILSATHIPMSTYILATAISLIKLTLHVYIGSTLSTLTGGDGDDTDPDKDPNNHGKRVKVFLLVMGIILGIGVGLYVWAVAKREIAITEAARMERRQRRRRSGARGGRSAEAASNRDSNRSDGIELSDHRGGYIPDVDLTNRDSVDGFFPGATSNRGGEGQDLSDANYFVGGARNETNRYQDYEDDGDHEGNSLFGTAGRSQGQHQQQGGDWRNVGAAAGASASHTDSLSDSDDSDYFDDSEDEDEDGGDLERGFGLGFDLNSDRVRGSDADRFGEGEDEDEALDFSAHHAGLTDSPWQDEEEGDDDRHDLLGGGRGGGGSMGRAR